MFTGPSRVTVRVGGAATPIDEALRHLDSYAPIAGDADSASAQCGRVADEWTARPA